METTNQSTNKNEIITLLLADMRNRKLIMGLEATGLATDEFNTNLSDLIFSKMEIDTQYHTIVFNWYEDTIYGLLDIDLNKFREHQLFFAITLYDALEVKKKQLQTAMHLKPKNKFSFLELVCRDKWFRMFDN